MVEKEDSEFPLEKIASKVNEVLNKPVDRVPTPINQVYSKRNIRTPKKLWNRVGNDIEYGLINKW